MESILQRKYTEKKRGAGGEREGGRDYFYALW